MKALLISAFLAATVSHWLTANYYRGEIAAEHEAALKDRLGAINAERVKREQVEQELKDSEVLYFEILQAKDDEIFNLNERLATGTSGLFIDAECSSDGTVPETSEAERRHSAAIARLSRESEQWYIRHRQLSQRYEETLKLCQDYVRRIQAQFTF